MNAVFVILAVLIIAAIIYIFLSPKEEDEERVEKENEDILEKTKDEDIKSIGNQIKLEDALSKTDEYVAVGGSTLNKVSPLNSDIANLRKYPKAIESEFTERDIAITEKNREMIVERFVDTSFGWFMRSASSVTMDGQIRVPFQSIHLLINNFNPVVQPDGTILVLNLATVEQSINLSFEKKIPFLIKDKKTGKITMIDSNMLNELILPESKEELKDRTETIKNLKTEIDNYKPLVPKLKEISSSYKELEVKYKKLSEIHEQAKKEFEQKLKNNSYKNKKENDLTTKVQAEKEKLKKELMLEQETNKDLRKKLNELVSKIEVDSKHETDETSMNENENENVEKKLATNQDKTHIHDNIPKCKSYEFIEYLKARVSTEKDMLVDPETKGSYLVSRGTENDYILYLSREIFKIVSEEFKKNKNCVSGLNFKMSNKYIYNASDESLVLCKLHRIFLKGNEMISQKNIYIFEPSELNSPTSSEMETAKAILDKGKAIEF